MSRVAIGHQGLDLAPGHRLDLETARKLIQVCPNPETDKEKALVRLAELTISTAPLYAQNPCSIMGPCNV